MMDMADDSSVQTRVVCNTAPAAASPQRKMLRRILVAVSALALTAMYFGGASTKQALNKAVVPMFGHMVQHGSTPSVSRTLYTPYDTATDTVLPAWTDSLADVWEPMAPTDTPLFWFLPKAGGAIIVRTFTYCLGLALASNKGTNTGNHVSVSINIHTMCPTVLVCLCVRFCVFCGCLSLSLSSSQWIHLVQCQCWKQCATCVWT